MARPVLLSILLVTLAACSTPRAAGDSMTPSTSRTTYAPMLWPLPEPDGFRTPPPPAWAQGQKVFDDAVTQANKGQHAAAAETFLKAAILLKVEIDNPFVQTLEAGRNAAYHNAYECFVASGKREAGRTRLEAIAREDLVMARSVEAILAAQ